MMLSHAALAEIAATVYRPGWSGVAGLDVDYALIPHGDELVVAFSGTHPQSALDWLRDARFLPTYIRGIGFVHDGFGDGARDAWAKIAPILGTHHAVVSIVGHSLGGAMAAIVAAIHAYERPGIPFRLVTMGQPRVAFINPWFHHLIAQGVERAIYARALDPVPDVPFAPLYTHGARSIPIGVSVGDSPAKRVENHAVARYVADLKALNL
jgi:hypothetical protein